MRSNTGINRILLPLFSVCLFIVLFICSFPYYKFYIDPDATSYLTIANRYAIGDYARAVNGLWSPFHPWLVAICIKFGVNGLFAAQLTNGLACIGILIVTNRLFSKFSIEQFAVSIYMLMLPLFLVYATYKQLFDDLWQVFFLLLYLLILTSDDFFVNKMKWVLCGIVGALAYFAKTYSFYFVLLHLLISLILLTRQNSIGYKTALRSYITVVVVILVVISPWLYALHSKYHKWTIGYAGSINSSWYLAGHKTFKPGIKYIIPPSYNNSPSNMEDPILNEGHLYSMWDSPHLFVTKITRVGYTVIRGLYELNQLSFLLIGILFITTVSVFYKRDSTLFSQQHVVLLLASLIMPAGYFTVHFEARYVWLLIFTSLILGTVWLAVLRKFLNSNKAYRISVVFFILSYVIFPVYDLKELFRKGEDIYKEGQQINSLHLEGTFTSNADPNRAPITAYLTHMPYYTIENRDIPVEELLAEMRKYRINYYLLYYKPLDNQTASMLDENGKPFPELTNGSIKGLKIFKINQ